MNVFHHSVWHFVKKSIFLFLMESSWSLRKDNGKWWKKKITFFFFLVLNVWHVISKRPKDSAQNQVISRRFLRFKPEFFTITWSINVSYNKLLKKKTWSCTLFDLDQIGILLALKRLVFLHYGLGKLGLRVQLMVFLYYTLHHGLIFSIQGHQSSVC